MTSLKKLGIAIGAIVAVSGAAQAADIPAKMPVKAQAPVVGPAAVYFAGAAVSPHSWFADAGAVWAFNRNLNIDGALLRVRGGTGEYEYLLAPGVENGVDHHLGEAMVGYQRYIGGIRYTGYIGVQVQNHDNDTDPAGLRGTKWGVTAQGEVFAPTSTGYALLLGQISSVHSSYFVMGKLGYSVSPTVSVGPEVAALGNKRFDAVRAGVFAALNLTANAQVIGSVGYNWGGGNRFRDNDGAYGTVHVRFLH
jgi:hypothetical protein